MAYTSSGTLSVGQTYNLGQYALRLIVTKVSEESITSIQCNCSKGSEHAQTGIDQSIDINVKSWRVVANGTSADVYARIYRGTIDTEPIKKPIPVAATGEYTDYTVSSRHKSKGLLRFVAGSGVLTGVALFNNKRGMQWIFASASAGARVAEISESGVISRTYDLTSQYTYLGKKVYTNSFARFKPAGYQYIDLSPVCNGGEQLSSSIGDASRITWYMVYGDPAFEKEVLVARFAIDIGDAGGGSGGTWEEPGSTGDPTYTLDVTVNGALSGRHNDPLNDTSYHHVPAEQDAATVYGSGGDGGHGGGGGAGASTVVIHTIATERAGNVEETAIAKRHGYGSGGGKGGKGGDGCILVYY